MEKEIENKLFELLFIKSMRYNDVVRELNIPIQGVRKFYKDVSEERRDEIDKIKRVRSLYNNKVYNNNKKKKNEFKFGDFKQFYEWYVNQESIQNGSCYYCGSDEFKIRHLVEKKIFGDSKQMINRGRHLEIERKNSKNNDYSPLNCVLACYFCNNDKSDVITEDDYFKYFVNEKPSSRKRYVDDKYSELLKKKK